MSHAIHCRDCDEYVWPPLDAEGPGGRTEIAAYELALQHVRENDHTDVHVVPGCYYVGDGRRPNAFDGERISPEDVAMPEKTKMARATARAARRLRSVADDLEDGDSPERHARHLRRYADAVESNIAADQATLTDGGAGEFERESRRAADRFCDDAAELAREYRDKEDVSEWVLCNQLRYLREDIEREEL